MRRCIAVACALVAGCGIPDLPDVQEPCGEWPEPGIFQVKIETPEKTRKALVQIGVSSGPRDMVVALHGGTSSAKKFMDATEYRDLLDGNNLVTVFPQGRKTWFWRMWNAGDCCGTIDEEHRDADDVAFLDALVADLKPKVCADRVLAVGFSNGSMMANRWACESDVPDAVVVAAGPLLTNTCEGPPTPYRAYHGTSDPKVPIQGGPSASGNNIWPPARDTWEIWKERNACQPEPMETFQFGEMTCDRYDCAAATEVCVLQGWGHAWPGGRNASRLQSNATPDSLTFLRYATGDGEAPSPSTPEGTQ